MIVRYAQSLKQPTLNSYYVSRFNNATLELIKSLRPLSTYHRDLKEYELPRESYAKIKEPVEQFIDQTVEYPKFKRECKNSFGYQEDAVKFLRKTSNALINFEQGMGKSLTTMKVVLDHKFGRTLVICGQSNLQEEWLKDAKKHGLDERLSMMIVGDDSDAGNAKKARWLRDRWERSGVDLINVEALRSEAIIEQINATRYDCIVFDEVQAVKGWKAQQTEGFQEIERRAGQYRIALSGTPVLNSPFEFFSVLKFFGVLGDTARTTFERYYGEWGFDFWGHYVCKGFRNLEELQGLLSPVLCYADKSELMLPKKTRKRIEIPFESEEFNYLRKVYKYSDARMKKAGFKSKPEIRAKMQVLSSTAPNKIAFVENIAREQKVLVFSSFTKVLDEYKRELETAGFKVLYYHGGLSMKERLEVLDEWRAGNADLMLLSVGAARYGLNLQEAKAVIFVDIPASLAVIAQCEDRSHRIGQTDEVVSYLLSASPIDEDALESIQAKQEALDSLMEMATENRT